MSELQELLNQLFCSHCHWIWVSELMLQFKATVIKRNGQGSDPSHHVWEYRYLLNDVQIPEYPSKDLCENLPANCEKSKAANGRVRNRLILDLGQLPAITDRCRYQMESGGIYQPPNLDVDQFWQHLAIRI